MSNVNVDCERERERDILKRRIGLNFRREVTLVRVQYAAAVVESAARFYLLVMFHS